MSRKQFQLSQADLATSLKVDRTTIRAWTRAGMPYQPPATQGSNGLYDLGIATLWATWTSCKSDWNLPKTDPLHVLAFAYFNNVHDSLQAVRDGLKLFPHLVCEYFDKNSIAEAMHWAIGYLDAKYPRAA